jgi:hypothetical protein
MGFAANTVNDIIRASTLANGRKVAMTPGKMAKTSSTWKAPPMTVNSVDAVADGTIVFDALRPDRDDQYGWHFGLGWHHHHPLRNRRS